MELQTVFYIFSIVFMSIMLLLIAALLAAVLVIKAKINKLHDSVEDKVNQAKSIVGKVTVGLSTLKYFMKRPDH